MTAATTVEPDTRPRKSRETTEEDRREFLATALAGASGAAAFFSGLPVCRDQFDRRARRYHYHNLR